MLPSLIFAVVDVVDALPNVNVVEHVVDVNTRRCEVDVALPSVVPVVCVVGVMCGCGCRWCRSLSGRSLPRCRRRRRFVLPLERSPSAVSSLG